MTTEKAIQLLHRLQDEQFDGPHGDERREALSMAVRALSGDGDTISRKAAMVVFENSGLDDDSKDTVVRVLEQLPSAQPLKKGKWIFHETENDRYDDMICPFCKTTYTVDAYRIDDIGLTAEDFNYCPSCGARMDGESDE